LEQTMIKKAPDQKQTTQMKALNLLHSLVGESKRLRSAENQIRLLCSVSELLSAGDAKFAREYLRDALRLFEELEPATGEGGNIYQMEDERTALRIQLAQAIALNDAEAAHEFLRSSRFRPDGADGFPDEQERQLEIQLALLSAEKTPALAFLLVGELLKQGLDFRSVEIWRRLDRTAPVSALKMGREMATKLKSVDLIENSEAASIVTEMIFELRSRIRTEPKRKHPSSGFSESLELGRKRLLERLLEILALSAVGLTPANLSDVNRQEQARSILSLTHSLLHEIDEYLPTRLAAVRIKLKEFDGAYLHQPEAKGVVQESAAKSARELLELAENSKGRTRDFLHNQALASSIEEADLELAARISQQYPRAITKQMRQELERLEREKSIRAGRFEEALENLREIPVPSERAQALIQIAHLIQQPTEQRRLLEEARLVLGDVLETEADVESEIALAIAYLPHDRTQAFHLLDVVIEKLNAVNSALMQVKRFSRNFETNPDEIQISELGLSQLFTGGLQQRIRLFSQCDFDRTRRSLARLEPLPLRLGLNLALAGGSLDIRGTHASLRACA
jgi:hypothetical protein